MGNAQGRTLREVDEQVIEAEGLFSWDSQGGDLSEDLGHPIISQEGKLRPERLNSSQCLASQSGMARTWQWIQHGKN